MSRIPDDAVRTLLEVGRAHETGGDAFLALLHLLPPFSEVDRQHWSAWDEVTSTMRTDDVVTLFRGLALAERGWSGGGSVAGAIWVFREVARRDAALGDRVADWALANTESPWVPFGTDRHGAHSLAEYRERKASREASRRHRLADVAESERQAEARRTVTREQRTHAASLRGSEARTQFIQALCRLGIGEQLEQLASDVEFPVEWYPTRLAHAAKGPPLAHLSPPLRSALLEKLKGKHRGPWAALKKRL